MNKRFGAFTQAPFDDHTVNLRFLRNDFEFLKDDRREHGHLPPRSECAAASAAWDRLSARTAGLQHEKPRDAERRQTEVIGSVVSSATQCNTYRNRRKA